MHLAKSNVVINIFKKVAYEGFELLPKDENF
jgi:hypothetical protein